MSRFENISEDSAKFDKGTITIYGQSDSYKISKIQYDPLFKTVVYVIVNIRNACNMYRISEPTLKHNLDNDLIEYQ